MTFDISLFKPVSWAIYWFCYFCWRIIKACTKALESKESVCFLKRDESGNSQSQGKPRFNKLEIFVSKRASSSARISTNRELYLPFKRGTLKILKKY